MGYGNIFIKNYLLILLYYIENLVDLLYNVFVCKSESVIFLNGFVYLDNSATTKPCKEAVAEIALALESGWGNPSSLHSLGFDSQMKMDAVRESVAKAVHCRKDEIFFTSGGTEANNTAVLVRPERGGALAKGSLPPQLSTLLF